MKIADLYIRVSTDEQADKGYSQRNQEEMLQKYCAMNGIAVRKVVYEDHSAKTFNRPQWKSLLLHLKRHKGKSDLILFLKWDRFSRNAGDAYQMINTLRKLGVEPQAIEEPEKRVAIWARLHMDMSTKATRLEENILGSMSLRLRY